MNLPFSLKKIPNPMMSNPKKQVVDPKGNLLELTLPASSFTQPQTGCCASTAVWCLPGETSAGLLGKGMMNLVCSCLWWMMDIKLTSGFRNLQDFHHVEWTSTFFIRIFGACSGETSTIVGLPEVRDGRSQGERHVELPLLETDGDKTPMERVPMAAGWRENWRKPLVVW